LLRQSISGSIRVSELCGKILDPDGQDGDHGNASEHRQTEGHVCLASVLHLFLMQSAH
jgi:hypothetical protein